MRSLISHCADTALWGHGISEEEALQLATVQGPDLPFLLAEANGLRHHFFGDQVQLCAIINAKSGRCPENCAFCAQSGHHATTAPVYPLLDEEQILAGAREAEGLGASCFGIVTSGTTIRPGAELEQVCHTLRRIRKETSIAPSCSLGIIDAETAQLLKDAGATSYHHNLETSRSFFPSICSTHDYEEDVATIRIAKKAGLSVCSGGILGLGESMAQRIELAVTLRELQVDSVPLNFLTPVAGTPLADASFLTPQECLIIIALFRFLLPTTPIKVCGGREYNLRELQSWIFLAGASGTMTGNYLTTVG
ncbi:MAG TPA: biotin synthase BioB, partial [Geobacterales bacterium]|nr:biotin synthase BioB [Geobacterales bacterium]